MPDALVSPVGRGEVVVRGIFLRLGGLLDGLDALEHLPRAASETGPNDRLCPESVPCDRAIPILDRELVNRWWWWQEATGAWQRGRGGGEVTRCKIFPNGVERRIRFRRVVVKDYYVETKPSVW